MNTRNADGTFRKKYTINESYFDTMTEEKAWLLGILASDGCVSKDGMQIRIGQSKDSGKKCIEHIKNILKYTGTIYKASSNISKHLHYSISFRSKILVQCLARYNIIPAKSLIYSFPDALQKEYYRDFIRGYIDGDGSIGIYDNGSGNTYIALSFFGTKKFINRCAEIIPISGKIRKINDQQEIRWYGIKAYDVCVWLFENDKIFKSSKYEKFEEFKKLIPSTSRFSAKILNREIQSHMAKDEQLTISQMSKKYNVPYKTVWKWKNRGRI